MFLFMTLGTSSWLERLEAQAVTVARLGICATSAVNDRP
jgi:hypothetical protein